MKYWWYAVILLVLAVVLTVLAIKLSKRPKLSYIISMTLSCVFLTYKSVEFIYSHIFLWTLFQVGNIKANFYNICISCPEKRT